MAGAAQDADLSSKLSLYFSCQGLKNMDKLSKSDPQVIILQQQRGSSTWTELGRTEKIDDNLNPRFSTAIEMQYFFEEVQKLKFVVVDVDDKARQWQDQDMIGEVESTLAKIVGSRGTTLTAPLMKEGHKKPRGEISVTAEEHGDARQADYKFRFSGRHLDKKDLFGKSDPYLVVLKQGGTGWIKVHQTEVVKNNLNPTWREFTISSMKLTGGIAERPLRFEVFDWDKNSDPDFIGGAEATLEMLEQSKELSLINPKKLKKRKYKDSGVLRVDGIEKTEIFSFLDFLRGDLQLNMMTTIDFTGSNGRIANPTSLHHLNPYELNQYQQVIQSVGHIVGCYDHDGMFPVYGFGAKLPGQSRANHCFALNGQANPEVPGIDGIMQWYQTCAQSVAFSGPTNFAPSIHVARQIAEQLNTPQTLGTGYLVLLILTDGVITDVDKTVEEIVSASSLPMSIIIVGVGKADFAQMEVLDADDGLLRSSSGKAATRDIVQFVPFRDFASLGPEALAAEVLRELPDQITGFFKMHGVKPRDPPPSYVP